jgi:rhodanese-related sulfurtransferase
MVTRIDRDEVRRLMGTGAQLVDVLSAKEFADSHIAGATNVPLDELGSRAREELDFSRPIIAYCNDFL